MKRVILPALATVLVVAALVGVLIVHSQAGHAAPAKHTTAWTTYHDPLGLYTISYPTGWKVTSTGTSNDWPTSDVLPSNGAERLFEASGDTLSIADSANTYAAINIRAIELNTSDARTRFCTPGMPTSPDLTQHGGTTFNTGNANIQVNTGLQGDPAIPANPTTLTLVRAAGSPSTYAPILATFHSLASAGSTC